ncbi:hypothetical protein O3P69_005652 [Scylla paramamosain]|uniref:Secreted protein n=1 Tax=Scylla paramamosain TaxID=85552 RepID=A0AAW0U872_SCYPA
MRIPRCLSGGWCAGFGPSVWLRLSRLVMGSPIIVAASVQAGDGESPSISSTCSCTEQEQEDLRVATQAAFTTKSH